MSMGDSGSSDGGRYLVKAQLHVFVSLGPDSRIKVIWSPVMRWERIFVPWRGGVLVGEGKRDSMEISPGKWGGCR